MTRSRNVAFWGVACLIVALFMVANWPWHLDDYDQAKQAFTSFQMVEEGRWLYQNTPNEKIATKPPLVGWVSAGLYAVTRSWELAWRLPSFAAAICLLVLLARSASAAYGAGAGLVAMSAFGLNLLSPRLATLVRTDMALALAVFLVGWRIWQKTRPGAAPWSRRDRVMMLLVLLAGMMIKGPIVAAFLLPGMILFRFLKRDAAVPAWFGWWPWLGALAVFALWVTGGVVWVPGFYEEVVLREFAGRFGGEVHRSQPFYFYLPHLLHKLAPWSVLMIVFAVVAWRGNGATWRERWRAVSPETAWLICWLVGGLLVMSLIPSKRVDRVFPLVPPFCLLLAAQFAGMRERMRAWGAIALVLAVLVISGYYASLVTRGSRAKEDALLEFGIRVRNEAARQGWRYEVVGGREEGLLLYLRKTRFAKREQVIAQWNAAELDALVIPAEELPELLPRLHGAGESETAAAITIGGRPRGYALLVR